MNLLKYFPNLSEEQQRQIAALEDLYRDWNAKINVISRKDIDNLYEHHVLHSMAIAFLNAPLNSLTVLARRFAWLRRCAMPSD